MMSSQQNQFLRELVSYKGISLNDFLTGVRFPEQFIVAVKYYLFISKLFKVEKIKEEALIELLLKNPHEFSQQIDNSSELAHICIAYPKYIPQVMETIFDYKEEYTRLLNTPYDLIVLCNAAPAYTEKLLHKILLNNSERFGHLYDKPDIDSLCKLIASFDEVGQVKKRPSEIDSKYISQVNKIFHENNAYSIKFRALLIDFMGCMNLLELDCVLLQINKIFENISALENTNDRATLLKCWLFLEYLPYKRFFCNAVQSIININMANEFFEALIKFFDDFLTPEDITYLFNKDYSEQSFYVPTMGVALAVDYNDIFRLRFIELYLTKGINLNDKNNSFGNTPLLFYISNAQNDRAINLLKATRNKPGINFDINTHSDKFGTSSIHLAVAKGYTTTDRACTPLIYSNLEVVRELLRSGADVNLPTLPLLGSQTALHYACAKRDFDLIKLLLLNKADTKCVNAKNQKPFDMLEISRDDAKKIIDDATDGQHLFDQQYEPNLEVILNKINNFIISDDHHKIISQRKMSDNIIFFKEPTQEPARKLSNGEVIYPLSNKT